MLTIGTLVVWTFVALACFAAWHLVIKRMFSTEARERRRRNRSYKPTNSSRSGPAVKLAVKPPRR